MANLNDKDKLIESAYNIIKANEIRTVFDIPENRTTDAATSNPAVPNIFSNTNQTTKTDFDYYYDISNSITSKNTLDTVIRYQQEKDIFEFQPLYKDLVDSIINNKVILSNITQEQIDNLLRASHDKDKDNALFGRVSMMPIKLNLEAVDNSYGRVLSVVIGGTTRGGLVLDEHIGLLFKDINIDWANVINKDAYSTADMDALLDQKVDVTTIFNEDGSITENFYNTIFNINDDSAFSLHVLNNDIHITNEERITWNDKYFKPVAGIPETDLDAGVRNILSDFITHRSNDNIHVTAAERDSWNKAVANQIPATGIPIAQLDPDIQYILNNALVRKDIIDPTTNRIYSNLIKIDTSNFVLATEYNNHITEFRTHVNGIGHITTIDRNNWNNKYTRPATGIPFSDLNNALQTQINSSVTKNDLFDETGYIRPEFIADGENLRQIISHIGNPNIHVTENDRAKWDSKYDGSLDSLRANEYFAHVDVDGVKEYYIPIEHLPRRVREIASGSLAYSDVFNESGYIPSNKVETLDALRSALLLHAGVVGGLDQISLGGHLTAEDRVALKEVYNKVSSSDIYQSNVTPTRLKNELVDPTYWVSKSDLIDRATGRIKLDLIPESVGGTPSSYEISMTVMNTMSLEQENEIVNKYGFSFATFNDIHDMIDKL